MKDKRKFSMPVTGGSSLLAIFAVLALTIFAVLSVSTAAADQRLADKSVSSVEGFYAADCQAEYILAQIRNGDVPEDVVQEGNVYIYSCPISETQQLLVEVWVEDADYEILRWQAAASAEWEIDESLPVWDGEVIIEENEIKGEGIWPL